MRRFNFSALLPLALAIIFLSLAPAHAQCPLVPLVNNFIEIDEFPNSSAVIELTGPNGSERITLRGPSTVHVAIGPNGEAVDTDADGLDQVKTQMVELELTGSSSFGQVKVEIRDIGKHPFQCSAGEIEEVQNTAAGRLDVPPFAPAGTAQSFFDLFFEITISTPGGPYVLHTHDPKRMSSLIDHKPPDTGTVYENPQEILLFEEDEDFSGFRLTAGFHVPMPEPGPPTCNTVVVTGGVDVTVGDPGTGLATVMVNRQQNAIIVIPGFPIGSPGPVKVTARKDKPDMQSLVELKVVDVSGNTIICDPVLTLQVRETGRPATDTVSNLPQAEGKITVGNGSPGVTALKIEVNGTKFMLTGLKDGEQRSLDVSSAMRPGNANVMTLTAQGKPGGGIEVIIHD